MFPHKQERTRNDPLVGQGIRDSAEASNLTLVYVGEMRKWKEVERKRANAGIDHFYFSVTGRVATVPPVS